VKPLTRFAGLRKNIAPLQDDLKILEKSRTLPGLFEVFF
jgi:hypothetical protein